MTLQVEPLVKNKLKDNLEESQIRAAQHDYKAFSPLYDKHYLNVFRFVCRRVENENIAADITSNVFIKALINIKNFEFRGIPLQAWLLRIAHNEIFQEFRKNKIERIVNIRTDQLKDVADESELSDNSYDLEVLMKTMQKLKMDELELVELRFFEKRAFKEISDILKISEAHARVRISRILKKLKKLINQKNYKNEKTCF